MGQVNMGTSLPTMPKIINLVNEHYSDLRFSKSTRDQEVMHHINPKRAQRLKIRGKRDILGGKVTDINKLYIRTTNRIVFLLSLACIITNYLSFIVMITVLS